MSSWSPVDRDLRTTRPRSTSRSRSEKATCGGSAAAPGPRSATRKRPTTTATAAASDPDQAGSKPLARHHVKLRAHAAGRQPHRRRVCLISVVRGIPAVESGNAQKFYTEPVFECKWTRTQSTYKFIRCPNSSVSAAQVGNTSTGAVISIRPSCRSALVRVLRRPVRHGRDQQHASIGCRRPRPSPRGASGRPGRVRLRGQGEPVPHAHEEAEGSRGAARSLFFSRARQLRPHARPGAVSAAAALAGQPRAPRARFSQALPQAAPARRRISRAELVRRRGVRRCCERHRRRAVPARHGGLGVTGRSRSGRSSTSAFTARREYSGSYGDERAGASGRSGWRHARAAGVPCLRLFQQRHRRSCAAGCGATARRRSWHWLAVRHLNPETDSAASISALHRLEPTDHHASNEQIQPRKHENTKARKHESTRKFICELHETSVLVSCALWLRSLGRQPTRRRTCSRRPRRSGGSADWPGRARSAVAAA